MQMKTLNDNYENTTLVNNKHVKQNHKCGALHLSPIKAPLHTLNLHDLNNYFTQISLH